MEDQLTYDSDEDTTNSTLFTEFMKNSFTGNRDNTSKGIKKEVPVPSNDSDEEYEEEEEEEESEDDDTKEDSSNEQEQILSDEEESKELEDIIKYKFNKLKRKNNFDLKDNQPVVKKRQTKKKTEYKTVSGLNIFRKVNSNLPDYLKLVDESNTNILFCRFSNYLLRVPYPVVDFNYNDLPEANIPKNSIPTRCEHVFETRNIQIACGDEAFTSIKICKLCNLTKTK